MPKLIGKGISYEDAIDRGIIQPSVANMVGLLCFEGKSPEPTGTVTNQFSEGKMTFAVIDDDFEICINGAQQIIQPWQQRTICRISI